MSSPAPKVSVVIPHFEDVANLERCLAALAAQTYPRSEFEVVVADNGSAIGPAGLTQMLAGRARLIIVEQRGAGPARNGGVAASTGEILAFIDSDCVADPRWLSEGLRALDRFDFVGGRVDVSVADCSRVSPTEAFEKVFAFDFETYINRKGFTGSGNLFVPRAVFDRVGGFRDRVSEDVEWSRRATSLGFRLGYAQQAAVAHPARRTWPELRTKWARINRESFALHLDRKGGRWRWLARSSLLPLSAVVHSPRILLSGKLHSPRERLGALSVLFRCRFWRFSDALKIALSR